MLIVNEVEFINKTLEMILPFFSVLIFLGFIFLVLVFFGYCKIVLELFNFFPDRSVFNDETEIPIATCRHPSPLIFGWILFIWKNEPSVEFVCVSKHVFFGGT